jgi:hypothetical protein
MAATSAVSRRAKKHEAFDHENSISRIVEESLNSMSSLSDQLCCMGMYKLYGVVSLYKGFMFRTGFSLRFHDIGSLRDSMPNFSSVFESIYRGDRR